MINRYKRVVLMEQLSAYFQMEGVDSSVKKDFSKALLSSDDISLHKMIKELHPLTNAGLRIKATIISSFLEEENYEYDNDNHNNG